MTNGKRIDNILINKREEIYKSKDEILLLYENYKNLLKYFAFSEFLDDSRIDKYLVVMKEKNKKYKALLRILSNCLLMNESIKASKYLKA